MCMLCAIAIPKWPRKFAIMLPWLVMPLIVLWALSQLLPPAYRFEITSSRLACVFVLLVTLFWYEILMPQLSAWRVRHNARVRQRKRFEALELQKLKKAATRKCRNCLTPYRDQNPGGGKFMCSYCGHTSKRPVLDLPGPPGLGVSNSQVVRELFGKSGNVLNGKDWSDNVLLCNQEWLENSNWLVSGSFQTKSAHPRRSSVGFFGGSEPCLAEKSYPGAYFFVYKLLTSFLASIRWLWRKLFRVSSSVGGGAPSDADHRGMLAKKAEGGATCQESRGEKARRKAEEKRQARLEKEMLEEEERKQREEVARLVEERRRLRDEKIEAENRAKVSTSLREKDSKKEAERKRREKKKERDKASSKSNSDVEELERKIGKENEQKQDTDMKVKTDRHDSQKVGTDSVKGQIAEGHGAKGDSANNFSGGNIGARYFDSMRGSFLSSSKAFAGSGLFGTQAPTFKESKPIDHVDQSQTSAIRRDFSPSVCVPGKIGVTGDDKTINSSVTPDSQYKSPPKSWQQLFTPAPAAPVSSQANVISRPNLKFQTEVQNTQITAPSTPTCDNPINFGLPSPFTLPSFSNGSMSNISSPPPAKDVLFPHKILPEEPELFEDPCYEPDPVSLLGPVSESLDDFQLDDRTGFIPNILGKCHSPLAVSGSFEVSRPSPIEPPRSFLTVADEKQSNRDRFPNSPKDQDMNPFPTTDLHDASETGMWHVWKSHPLGLDGLGLVPGLRRPNEGCTHPSCQKPMASLFTKDGPVAPGAYSPWEFFPDNGQRSSVFGSSIPSSSGHDALLQRSTRFRPLSSEENGIPINHVEDASQKKMVYGSPRMTPVNHKFDPFQGSGWPKNERAGQGLGEATKYAPVVKPTAGGLYSTPDVQSLWSFE